MREIRTAQAAFLSKSYIGKIVLTLGDL